MNALQQLAKLISDASNQHGSEAIERSQRALTDTIACIFSGSDTDVALRSFQAVKDWGQGEAVIIGQSYSTSPPFAAMVNGAAAHAQDFDDFDSPANAHPSAVLYPALLAQASNRLCSGRDLLDAHIIGIEVMQRLGEAMNMAHYRRGWLSTLTIGSLGAAAASARLLQLDTDRAAAALSVAASMASGLTNQGGYLCKQLHPGLAAKNGVMAAALAQAGIDGSDQVIDGEISLARCMGDYQLEKFTAALKKLGDPWSILEHGLLMKAYPTCGYTHRVVDAAIALHPQLEENDLLQIDKIEISVPDYYLDLLIYPDPKTPAEAMFSAEYNVVSALLRGDFQLQDLNQSTLMGQQRRQLLKLCSVIGRIPPDKNIVYDPEDPDFVVVHLKDGRVLRAETRHLTGSPQKPMSETAFRKKFDSCVGSRKSPAGSKDLWQKLHGVDELGDIGSLLASLKAS
ncbi:MAG: MmgE/PrpD family protein [Pseudomonadota bacterium]